MDAITEFLRSHGPSLSSVVASHLISTEEVAGAAARKRIQRAGGEVRRLGGIRLPHREGFLFLESQANTEAFANSLLLALDSTGSVYGCAFRSLEARGGVCPLDEFHVVSGAPLRLKGQLATEVVLRNLVALRLADRRVVAGLGECVVYGERAFRDPIGILPARARLLADRILLDATVTWARNLGLVSFNAVKTRLAGAEFGQFRWDLSGPSYLRPIATLGKGGNGFFVADVSSTENMSKEQVAYFLRKASIIRGQKRSRPFLAMLVADGFTKEAWNAARSDGLLVATPRHLFGEAVAAGLRELVQTLSNAAAAAAKNPEVIWTLFSKLGEVEGAAANLRGPLFEMIVAHGVRAVDGASIEIGKQVAAPSGQLAEVDVLATKPDHWRFIECRGHAPGHRVSLDQVKTWCEEKVPRIREWALNRIERTQTRMSFEYWTTGTFEGEAEEYLDRRRSRTNKYDLARMDGPAVLEYARRVGSRHIVDTLNEHYFRHPLAHAVGREEAHGPGDTASGAPSSNSRDLDSRPR